MISDARMEKALTYLAETDEESAELKANVARAEYLCKLARSRAFILAEGSVELRKALAETSDGVMNAEEGLAGAIVNFEKVKARRSTQELVVETWRTYQANRRVGQV